MGFLGKLFGIKEKESLDQGLQQTKEGFFAKITKAIAGKSTVDDEVLDNLEEALIGADVGMETTIQIIERIEKRVKQDKYLNTNELNALLQQEIEAILPEIVTTRDNGYLAVNQYGGVRMVALPTSPTLQQGDLYIDTLTGNVKIVL